MNNLLYDGRPEISGDRFPRSDIETENRYLLHRYVEFRRAADAVAAAWRKHAEVAAIALIGSVAKRPWKEVPRFARYRRGRVALWHECKDVDLALWLSDVQGLDRLRRAKDKALLGLHAPGGAGVASHQVDVFILEPVSNRYLGRLCPFNECPKGKIECLVPGCGAISFLRQHDAFCWQPDSLAADRALRLFDRASGQILRAADLPLPSEDEEPEAASGRL
jgi:hypothetical protein